MTDCGGSAAIHPPHHSHTTAFERAWPGLIALGDVFQAAQVADYRFQSTVE